MPLGVGKKRLGRFIGRLRPFGLVGTFEGRERPKSDKHSFYPAVNDWAIDKINPFNLNLLNLYR
jgi:hypothetical protein